MKTLFLSLIFTAQLFAITHVGQRPPNLSWIDSNDRTVQLSDFHNRVVVLIYSAGWCAPCRREMSELIPRLHEVSNLPVTFLSLLIEGWQHGTPTDRTFLNDWKSRFHIPFTVAATENAGSEFFDGKRYIPAIVILDRSGRVSFADNEGISIEELFAQIRRANRT